MLRGALFTRLILPVDFSTWYVRAPRTFTRHTPVVFSPYLVFSSKILQRSSDERLSEEKAAQPENGGCHAILHP